MGTWHQGKLIENKTTQDMDREKAGVRTEAKVKTGPREEDRGEEALTHEPKTFCATYAAEPDIGEGTARGPDGVTTRLVEDPAERSGATGRTLEKDHVTTHTSAQRVSTF